MMLADAHTHHPLANTYAIQNIDDTVFFPDQWFSFGLHPWHAASADFEHYKEKLLRAHAHPKFVALGEVGLDRACEVDFEIQKEIFIKQLELVQTLKIEVIVIHCVRALNDILSILKIHPVRAKLLFHDANFTLQDCHLLTSRGYYLSFGKNLMRAKSKAKDSFARIDQDFVLLETDDSGLDIASVYEHAAGLLQVETHELEARYLKNFQRLYPMVK